MQSFNKCEVDSNTYDVLKKVQLNNGTNIKEHLIGSRKKLYSYNYLIATTANSAQLELNGISSQKFNSFIGMFNRNLYKQFYKKPELYDVYIKYDGLAREKNYLLWDSLPEDTFFYNVDLSSAYWQIAHSIGYISDKLFTNYMYLDEYKTMKRYCISFLARKNKMKYTNSSAYSHEIICDTSVFQKVYDNIRNELYYSIEQVRIKCENCIEYNIDGVMILNSDLKEVKKELKRLNLEYKITECVNLNEKEYVYGSKIRRFKNK